MAHGTSWCILCACCEVVALRLRKKIHTTQSDLIYIEAQNSTSLAPYLTLTGTIYLPQILIASQLSLLARV